MINEKWLKISMFIPLWGTIINTLILFIEYVKHKSFKLIKLYGGMLLTGLTFIIVTFLISQAVKYIICQFVNLQLEGYMILLISFVVAGIIMNVSFLLYYRKVFATKTKEE